MARGVLATAGQAPPPEPYHAASPRAQIFLRMAWLANPFAYIAIQTLIATIPGMAGVLLTFDEFITGTEIFGEHIQPLMQCRRHVVSPAKAAA